MPTTFEEKKARIIQQLNVPEREYNDLSPKGSIDAGVRDLIDAINAIPTLVTTSSCAGRVSVYVEGRKQEAHSASAESTGIVASAGGKGGGRWLFVSHDPVASHSSIYELFELSDEIDANGSRLTAAISFVHFKFEAMILHILTSSLDDAGKILAAASAAGFRESGAMGLTTNKDGSITPMVAVRSNGLALDSIVGYLSQNDKAVCLVSEAHIAMLNDIANERFKVNSERIARFREALLAAYTGPQAAKGAPRAEEREDAAVRRARKQAEGLARQAALRSQESHVNGDEIFADLQFPS